MRFQPGHTKLGGRCKGTPNKRTLDLAARLDALGLDVVQELVTLAMDPETPLELRARVLADLLPYVYPKRKAVEVSGEGGGPVRIAVRQFFEPLLRDAAPEP